MGGRTLGCPLWVEKKERWCGPAPRRGYKRSRPRRQLPTPRSSAAIAESTEPNVTGACNRAVTWIWDMELRRDGGQLGEPWSEGGTHCNTGMRPRRSPMASRTTSGLIPF